VCKARYCSFVSEKLEYFEKLQFQNTKFHENPCSFPRFVACGKTDRLPERAQLVVAIFRLVSAPKITFALQL
jgi:hypothetical protein